MATPPFEQRLTGLTPDELAVARAMVAEVEVCSREIASLEARKAAAIAQLARLADADAERSANPDGRDYARRALSAEVAAVTHTHPHSARSAMDEAERLTDDFPATFAALGEGRISKRHADAILDTAGPVSAEYRAEFDEVAAALAETRTPGDVRRLARVKAEQLQEKSLRERHREARVERRVTVTDREDGMSELYAYLPTLEARAIKERLTETARVVKRDRARARAEHAQHARRPQHAAGVQGSSVNGLSVDGASEVAMTDRRTMDQLRADAFAMMLLTAEPSGHELFFAGTVADLESVRATVQVTIPTTMIMNADDGAAWLDEGVLVSPDSARHLAGVAPGWERLFVKPDTGEIIATDHYRPTAAQRRRLIGRDVSCRFPGCTVPARKADIDHTQDYARGGRTAIDNLACLCEAHHVMKHQSGWTVRQVADGVLEWTSPTGRVHRDEPPGRVFFADSAPTAEPPPCDVDLPDAATTAGPTSAPHASRRPRAPRAQGRRLTIDDLTANGTWDFPDAPGDDPAPWETEARAEPAPAHRAQPAPAHRAQPVPEHRTQPGPEHRAQPGPERPDGPSSDDRVQLEPGHGAQPAPEHRADRASMPTASLFETQLAAMLPALTRHTYRSLVDLHRAPAS